MPEVGTRVSWTECLVVGIVVFGLVGTGGVLLLLAGVVSFIRSDTRFWDAVKGTDPSVVACAATAAAIVGVAAWRAMVATTDSGARHGAAAGFVVGLAAHPVGWVLYLIVHVLREPIPAGQSVYAMAFGVAAMTVTFTFSSLVFLGWMSAPLFAALGYLVKRIL